MTPRGVFKRLSVFNTARPQDVYVLDIGNTTVKCGVLALGKNNDSAILTNVVVEPHACDEAAFVTGSPEFNAFAQTCRQALRKAGRRGKRNEDVVIGVALQVVQGRSDSRLFRRDAPEELITSEELSNYIQKAQLQAYEDIRKTFERESGYAEHDAYILNAFLQEIKLDDRRVEDPTGMKGRELTIEIFNAYMPARYRNAFQQLATVLSLNLRSVVYEPYALFTALEQHTHRNKEAFIIDIGGRSTRVSLTRRGKLADGRSFAFGGASFTERIAHEYCLTTDAAQSIQVRFACKNLSPHAYEKIHQALEPEFSVFLRAFEMVLKEFSQVSLLPGAMYVYGGGANIPLIDGIIKKRRWKKDLSFLEPPKIERVSPELFQTALAEHIPFNPALVSLLALSDYASRVVMSKEPPLTRTLRRMVTILQE